MKTYVPHLIYSRSFGEKTLSENIADNGGIKIAYKAFKKKYSNLDKLPNSGLNLTAQQLFWVGYAQDYCLIGNPSPYSEYKDTGDLIQQSVQRISSHAPAPWRVNTVLSNQPEFAEDFNCPAGARLNRPDERCSVW